jgi:glutamate-5-semialdehyde dehydrogenase
MSTVSLPDLGRRAKAAARLLATVSSSAKNDALAQAADHLVERSDEILSANAQDVARTVEAGASSTVVDRLRLSEARVNAMADGLRAVAALPDPVGEVVEGYERPNGLRVQRVRVPLGVVGIIYENRPNVTADAAALCLKSGNAALLRGSAGALESNKVIASSLSRAIDKAGLPGDGVLLVEDTAHETAVEFVRLRGVIDCLIPRGGPALLSMIVEHATVPYVLDGDGNCHVYVDASADLAMAERIVVNAKVQRPSVCNAAETLLVHKDVAGAFLPQVHRALEGVVLAADERSLPLLAGARPATEADFATEFLALELAVGVVDDLDGAISHIARFGSGHSEAIVTSDLASATRFVREVDAAAVLVNASTRFIDGGELGLGAEVGISTQKLHARGPMGLRELTCVKYVVYGEGQIRS